MPLLADFGLDIDSINLLNKTEKFKNKAVWIYFQLIHRLIGGILFSLAFSVFAPNIAAIFDVLLYVFFASSGLYLIRVC